MKDKARYWAMAAISRETWRLRRDSRGFRISHKDILSDRPKGKGFQQASSSFQTSRFRRCLPKSAHNYVGRLCQPIGIEKQLHTACQLSCIQFKSLIDSYMYALVQVYLLMKIRIIYFILLTEGGWFWSQIANQFASQRHLCCLVTHRSLCVSPFLHRGLSELWSHRAK